MTSANLKSRLGKLEAQRCASAKVFSNSILVGVFDNNASEIVGAGILGKWVMRETGETIESLTGRACRQLGMQVLFAVYKNGLEAC